MEKEYKLLTKSMGYKAKIYTTMPSQLKKRIGNPDAIIILMSTISHKMVETALKDARKKKIPIMKVNNSSKEAFIKCLQHMKDCDMDCEKCMYEFL